MKNYDLKDETRILELMSKTMGNSPEQLSPLPKAHQLAISMANKITDGDKAIRRGNAADALGYSSVADIFFARAKNLGAIFIEEPFNDKAVREQNPANIEGSKEFNSVNKESLNKTTLYQKDTKGRTKLWGIEVIDKNTHAEILVQSGLIDGAITSEITVIDKGLNLGKANATTPYTQALAEAQSKIEKKIRAGYVENLSEVREAKELGSGIKGPMLAQKFDNTKKQASSKNLDDLKLRGKKIFTQRKKDGNRCKVIIDSNGISMWTRKGDQQPLLTHITDTIVENFIKASKETGLDRFELDGEIFTTAYSFNRLNGLIKREKKTAEDIELCKQIKFHLYDIDLPIGYEERYKIIQHFASSTVHIEEAEEIVATPENITTKLEKYLAEGEEGLMIRVPGVPYENKRSWSLLKVKIFEDMEFEIVGFEESTRRGMVGAVICKMDCAAKDRDGKPIVTFKAGLQASHEEATEIWNNKNKYIGKQGTVTYFCRSEYSVPRFPKFKSFRD